MTNGNVTSRDLGGCVFDVAPSSAQLGGMVTDENLAGVIAKDQGC